MKRILATTAIALVAAAPAAYAQGIGFMQSAEQGDTFGSDIIGMSTYAVESEVDSMEPVGADLMAGWSDIGEVNDLVIGADGNLKGMLIDIGGFLGLGEHTVAVPMDDTTLLVDENGDRFLTIAATREELEAAPEFERSYDGMDTAAAEDTATGLTPGVTGDTMAADPMTENTVAPTAEGTAMGPNYEALPREELTAERLDGATIYGPGDESIGEISELVLDADGQVSEAVLDIGGFLGMGEHTVALSFDELEVMHDAASGEVRVQSNMTREELEAYPAYEG
jgi:hypothetical protein